MENKNSNKGLAVLVCGSGRLEDRNLVFGALDAMMAQGAPIGTVITSKFSGACQYAAEWVALANEKFNMNIKIKECSFDNLLSGNNSDMYEFVNVPEFITKHDPFYQAGMKALVASGANAILAFPNPEGQLGTATRHIENFAKMAGLGRFFLNCSDLAGRIKEHRACAQTEANVTPDGHQKTASKIAKF